MGRTLKLIVLFIIIVPAAILIWLPFDFAFGGGSAKTANTLLTNGIAIETEITDYRRTKNTSNNRGGTWIKYSFAHNGTVIESKWKRTQSFSRQDKGRNTTVLVDRENSNIYMLEAHALAALESDAFWRQNWWKLLVFVAGGIALLNVIHKLDPDPLI